MQHTDSNIRPSHAPQVAARDGIDRAFPTFIAADLLEKLITDRDARAVDRVVVQGRK
jgi:hypothetical protein